MKLSLAGLKERLFLMFETKEDAITLMRKFEQRKWKRTENFSNYFQEKVVLGNKLNITEKEMISYVIEGFDDPTLQIQAKMSQFKSLNQVLSVMNEVTSAERMQKSKRPLYHKPPPGDNAKNSAFQGTSSVKSRCYNCNQEGHLASACPKPRRPRGSCYVCGSSSHQIRDCPEKRQEVKKVTADSTTYLLQVISAYYLNLKLMVKIEEGSQEFMVKAVIDTGSPVSLIRRSLIPEASMQPCTEDDPLCEGINKSLLRCLGKIIFDVEVPNGVKFKLCLYVVSDDTMRTECLLWRNFTKHPQLNVVISADHVEVKMAQNYELMAIDLNEEQHLNLNICSEIKPEDSFKLTNTFQTEYAKYDHATEPKIKFKADITLETGHKKFYQPPRRLSASDKRIMTELITDMLHRKIIKKSSSAYASPIVLCNKKDGTKRLCVDFRFLNKIAHRERFPLPRVDDQLDRLKGKRYYSKLDLKDAFYNVQLSDESTQYTSFVTPLGQYEFLKLPFGFCNSPSIFTRFVMEVFRDLIEQGKITIYLDNILVATETIEENIEILKEIFRLLAENFLELKLQKCSFLYPEVEYLGYLVNYDGIVPNPEHIKSVDRFPVPTNSRQVHSFLGLASYFRGFVPNFSVKAKPLYELIKKNAAFQFREKELRVMEYLKEQLINSPVLAIYSPSADTELHCDQVLTVLAQCCCKDKIREISILLVITVNVLPLLNLNITVTNWNVLLLLMPLKDLMFI